MNVLDLINRELQRITGDFRALAGLAADEQRTRCGLALGGRITAYLRAEERVLYPTLIAVALGLRPAMVAHQQRLKRRAADAMAKLRAGDALADAAVCKLEQEMLRYARCHQHELLPRLADALGERELRLLGGEMLLTLASNRMPESPALPAWAQSMPIGRRSLPLDADNLPLLCDVIEAGDPLQHRPAARHDGGAAWLS